MSFSVNTNNGAAIALQYLSSTQAQLDKTQSAINSGLKVANARDDGAHVAFGQLRIGGDLRPAVDAHGFADAGDKEEQ